MRGWKKRHIVMEYDSDTDDNSKHLLPVGIADGYFWEKKKTRSIRLKSSSGIEQDVHYGRQMKYQFCHIFSCLLGA